MLFRSILTAGFLAATVLADGNAIIASLQTVKNGLVDLEGAFAAYQGGVIKALPILRVSNKLKDYIKDGTKIAKKSAPLSIDEAVALVPYVQALSTQTNLTLTTIIAKAPVFRESRLDGIVLRQIQDSKENSGGYSDAIIAKVPASLQESAKSLTAGIDTGFDQVIAAYSPQPRSRKNKYGNREDYD